LPVHDVHTGALPTTAQVPRPLQAFAADGGHAVHASFWLATAR
jgi:hypothetical protein